MIHSIRTKEVLLTGKKFIVGYLLAGYKNDTHFFETMQICENSSIDILEIGFPARNPYADGEIISEAHRIADFELATSLDYWKEIRNQTHKPIWLMAYNDDFISAGTYKEFANARIFDALVLPDVENSIKLKLQDELKDLHIDIIGFANPEMDEKELSFILSNFPIVYEQLYVGQTGVEQKEAIYHEMLKFSLEKYPQTICFGGFGLHTPTEIKNVLNNGFFGAVIGTEIIKKVNISLEKLETFLKEINEVK